MEGRIAGSIQKGLLVLIGVGQEDTEAAADKYLKKLLGLRIFEDENGKTNLSLRMWWENFCWSPSLPFTPAAARANRPSFTEAGSPELAEQLYEYIVRQARKQVPRVETGIFGAHMEVTLVNDGPLQFCWKIYKFSVFINNLFLNKQFISNFSYKILILLLTDPYLPAIIKPSKEEEDRPPKT